MTRPWPYAVVAAPCCLLAAVTFHMLVASAQTPFDPRSLVGEWQGHWTTVQSLMLRRGFTDTGNYYLTIQRVDGKKVFLKELAITQKARHEREYEGELDGNVLTYGGAKANPFVRLTIDGTKMTGRSRTLKDGADIELTKISP